MIFGVEPFNGATAREVYFDIVKKKEFFKDNNQPITFNGTTASKNVELFLKQTLAFDSDRRLNWDQLVCHPIFNEVDESKLLGDEFRFDVDIAAPEISQSMQLIDPEHMDEFKTEKK